MKVINIDQYADLFCDPEAFNEFVELLNNDVTMLYYKNQATCVIVPAEQVMEDITSAIMNKIIDNTTPENSIIPMEFPQGIPESLQEYTNKIAEKIKTERQKQNFSKKELAIQAGLTKELIEDLENKQAVPNALIISKIAKALNLPESDFDS